MGRYWIVAVSEENWLVVKELCIFGAPEGVGTRSAHELIRPGDTVIFYVRVRGSRNLGGKFVGGV